MSDTVEIPLPEGEWVKIASGPVKGYVSNESASNFLIRESDDAVVPTDTVGHTVSARDEIGFTYDIKNNQAIYCMASSTSSANTKATVTPLS